jgi:phage shock protein E
MITVRSSRATAVAVAGVLVFAASLARPSGQSSTTPPPAKTAADVPRVTTREFMKMHAAGSVLVVDVRSAEVFRLGRIAGAINVPLEQVASRAAEIRERAGGRIIVTYCSCAAELSSAEAGLRLISAGATNVRALVGGYPEWVLAGGAVER